MKNKLLKGLLIAGLGVISATATVGAVACKKDKNNDDQHNTQEQTWKVTFDSKGGSAVSQASVKDGEKVAKPATDPTREGYQFGGWFSDADCTQVFDFNNTTITKNTTLYAKWVPNGEDMEYVVTFDLNGHGGTTAPAPVTVTEGGKLTAPTPPTDAEYNFVGWYKDVAGTDEFDFENDTITEAITLYAKWEPKETGGGGGQGGDVTTGYTLTIDYDDVLPNGTLQSAADGNLTKPADPTDPTSTYHFEGWYADADFLSEFNWDTPIIGATTVYAKWSEDAVTAFDYAAGYATGFYNGGNGKTTEDLTIGKFTVGTGVYFENDAINTQGARQIHFTLAGSTNSISFEANRASGSGETTPTLHKEDGTPVTTGLSSIKNSATDGTWGNTWATAGAGASGQYKYKAEGLPAGDYYIAVDTGARIYNLQVSERVVKSDVEGIRVATGGTRDYLEGTAALVDDINVQLVYGSGRTVPVTSGYTINTSDYNPATTGKQTIKVSYTFKGTAYDTTYDVYVYDVTELVVYDYSLDSSRKTQNVQTLFDVGDDFNSENIGVKVKATVTKDETPVTKEFVLTSAQYTVNCDAAELVAGTHTVTVSGNYSGYSDKSDTYTITVVDLTQVTDKANITVDANGTAGVEAGKLTVTRIADALKAFELLETPAATDKTIEIKQGEYNEKLWIDIPNLKLKGVQDNAEQVVIWYDALNGVIDPSGTTLHSTDGSASVTIAEGAEGFSAEYVTFKNYYNTNALYQESLTITKNSQAVACRVVADKVVFTHCRFTSYHDTLMDEEGRHVYNDCYIEGRTDYIFGYNSTAYFKNCTIRSIGADDEKNGGYVVATKGTTSGNSIKYGYIFDGCTFEGDEHVVAGTVSIARGWDTGMTIVVMNSTISDKFSLEEYGNTTSPKNDRYGKMNADPVAAQLFEYNNTGDGALTNEYLTEHYATVSDESVTWDSLSNNVTIPNLATILSQTNAEAFRQMTTIFGTTNGGLTYSEVWGGTLTKVTLTIKNSADGHDSETATYTAIENSKVTVAELKALIESFTPSQEGYIFDKFTTDKAGDNPVDFSTFTMTGSPEFYVQWKEKPSYPATVSKLFDEHVAAVAADGQIEDNELFTAVANEAMEAFTTFSKTLSITKTVSETGHEVKGSLRSSSKTSAKGAASGGLFSITAKTDITLYIYGNTCNDSYNSNKAGKLYWWNGDKNATQSLTNYAAVGASPDRWTSSVTTIELTADQTITLAVSGDDDKVRFYLFGLEAKLKAE